MSFCINLFDNKLQLCGALMLWTFVSCSVFCFIMIKDGSNFLTIGPNSANSLLGVKMDTWFKWWVTAIYTFVSTSIAAFASDALCPFFSNVIEDHKTKFIPYSKFNCLMMVQCFTIYGVIMSVIGMFVALTQVDFMLIRIAADLVVNAHTTYYFLRGKEVDPVRYDMWKSSAADRSCAGSPREQKMINSSDNCDDSSTHPLSAIDGREEMHLKTPLACTRSLSVECVTKSNMHV
jgi:hypothetical protein